MSKLLPQRKPHRLKNYDYSSSGAYFITICTHQKIHLFGEVENGDMNYNKFGEIACGEIERTNEIRKDKGIIICNWVVMPNHIHLLVELVGSRRAVTEQREYFAKPTENSIPTIIRAYKSAVTKSIRLSVTEKEKANGWCDDGHGTPCPYKIWQRDYHDHIIRTEKEYERIWTYIESNPLLWNEDCYNEINQ